MLCGMTPAYAGKMKFSRCPHHLTNGVLLLCMQDNNVPIYFMWATPQYLRAYHKQIAPKSLTSCVGYNAIAYSHNITDLWLIIFVFLASFKFLPQVCFHLVKYPSTY